MSCTLAGESHCNLRCSGALPPPGQSAMQSTDFASLKPRDFDQRPMLVIWGTTQACDLKCKHCRANSRTQRHPLELSTAEAFHLIDQIADMPVPLFVLTGGDPLK